MGPRTCQHPGSTTSPSLLAPFFDRESAERELLRRGGDPDGQ